MDIKEPDCPYCPYCYNGTIIFSQSNEFFCNICTKNVKIKGYSKED